MTTVLRQASLIAAKDTRIFFRDRFALIFSFLFPLLFVVGFSLALGDVGPSDDDFIFFVSTQEERGISRQIIESLTSAEDSSVVYLEYDDAARRTEDGEIDGFTLFPGDFTERLFGDPPASIEIALGGASPGERAAIRGFADSIAGQLGQIGTTMAVIAEVGGPEALGRADPASMAAGPGLVELEAEQVGGIEPVPATNFTLPAYLTMFVFFAAAMSAEAIARERQNHTLERLMSNGTRRESVIVGKFLTSIYRGFMQLAFLWVVGIFAFNIDLGATAPAVILVSLLMALASSCFGVMLAAIVKTHNAAVSAGVLLSMTFAPLGGCWWPLFITPQWMQSLGKLTPHGWANTAFNKLMLFGAEFGDVLPEMGMLALFAAAFMAVALWRFRLSI